MLKLAAAPPILYKAPVHDANVLLVAGPHSKVLFDVVEDVAAAVSMDLVAAEDPDTIDTWLGRRRPHAIVLDADHDGAEPAGIRLRENIALSSIPILAATRRLSDLLFAEVFGWGADDLVRLDHPVQLERRLRAFPVSPGAAQPPAPRGRVLVADPDERRRVLSSRVLRNAGYQVEHVSTASDVATAVASGGVAYVVSNADLDGDGEPLVAAARREGVEIPWVIAASPRALARTRNAVGAVRGVAVYDAFGPPEDVLFVANELLRGAAPDGRASARLLYGAMVAFRQAGRDEDDVGYAYNVSAGGLYVRTTAPLARGEEAWIELQPPRTDRRVRLEGAVAWSRPHAPAASATVPAGFGLQITGGSMADLERYARGYHAFAAALAG